MQCDSIGGQVQRRRRGRLHSVSVACEDAMQVNVGDVEAMQ